MDFITRTDRDSEQTEMFYGKKSEQFALKNVMLDAENKLRTTGVLRVGKECTNEYILYTFYTGIFDKNEVHSVIKSYWNKGKTELRKKKEKSICKSISDISDNDIYDLILKGYKIVEL